MLCSFKESAKRQKRFKGGNVGCANRSPSSPVLLLLGCTLPYFCSLVAILNFGPQPPVFHIFSDALHCSVLLGFNITACKDKSQNLETLFLLLSCPSRSNMCHKSSEISSSSSHKLKRGHRHFRGIFFNLVKCLDVSSFFKISRNFGFEEILDLEKFELCHAK